MYFRESTSVQLAWSIAGSPSSLYFDIPFYFRKGFTKFVSIQRVGQKLIRFRLAEGLGIFGTGSSEDGLEFTKGLPKRN
jgi:hypothetical protein